MYTAKLLPDGVLLLPHHHQEAHLAQMHAIPLAAYKSCIKAPYFHRCFRKRKTGMLHEAKLLIAAFLSFL